MTAKISLLLAFLAILCSPDWVLAQRVEIKALETWSGKLADKSLRGKLAPQTEFITDAAAWKKLWQAWRPDQEVPHVDFAQDLVLVGTAPGPNNVGMNPQIDADGNVTFVIFSTKMGGPGFGYKLVQVERKGIATINGHAVKEANEDSITVSVVGTVRTGLVAIGGETTGTTITANEITWELDFGQNAKLRQLADKLAGKKATVKGTLVRRPGVEGPTRWIVEVTKLKAATAEQETAPKQDGLSAVVSKGKVKFLQHAEATIFDITSEKGIGTATIHRTADHWPGQVLVRLHLKGLESLQVSNAKGVFEWSLASGGDHQQTTTYQSGREHSTLAPPSLLYTEVKIVGGNASIPLEGGYFEVPLPAPLFADNPSEITLRWIDFYR
ncbi:hypothetical protein DTL42_18175 [Bremerella cremea]|uniref:Uncharacterized protein n=1 Tax=Bremerella cremea TaxID=1031537 RepID=A0A368KPS2_9BACT|nr:hypothetical protein [Bremerella cremea]RCS43916.1 hypothetical protein DTL42_18175 [Bremerella cremea]